jgi:hypothetical protein
MARSCSICKHPQKLAIEEAFLRNGQSLRVIAERHGVSAWALHRHKSHLAVAVMAAAKRERNAGEIVAGNSLLMRVEEVLTEVRDIAHAAKKAKDWSAATAALRELRNCLQLLGRMSGELLQQPTAGELHLHRHQHLHVEEQRSVEDLDREIAEYIRQGTNDFDPEEIERLRLLVHPVLQ